MKASGRSGNAGVPAACELHCRQRLVWTRMSMWLVVRERSADADSS